MTTQNQTETSFTTAALENLTFGIEIETVGVSRPSLSAAVARALVASGRDCRVEHGGGAVRLADGREWLVVRDGSLPTDVSGEVVSPILKGTADMEMVQVVVRGLREAGARSSAAECCGIHVHVGIKQFTPVQVAAVTRVAAKSDRLLRGCAKPSASRTRWCPVPPTAMVRRMAKATTWEQVASAWYGPRVNVRDAASSHYHQSRYCGVNLHSFFYTTTHRWNDAVSPGRGTLEFRYFDGTLHAGKIRAYITLCLAVVAKGLSAAPTWRGAALTDLDTTATRADVDTLLRTAFGLTGPTHGAVREHITAAWESNATAEAVAA